MIKKEIKPGEPGYASGQGHYEYRPWTDCYPEDWDGPRSGAGYDLYGSLMGRPQEAITAIYMPEAVTNKKFYYSEYTAIFKILSALFSKIS